MKEDIRSIEQLQTEVEKMLLMADRDIIRILAAISISQVLRFDPIWLLLITSSGGGKSALVDLLAKISYVHTLDTLTVNTFASAMKIAGKETALLRKIKNGILVFKDFTSILEMNEVARREIMSQLRAIYDGKFIRHAGNGEEIKWEGKISTIACSTTTIYHHLSKFATMGERFVIYELQQPPRKEVTKKTFERKRVNIDPSVMRNHLQDCFVSYITNVREVLINNDFRTTDISELLENEIIEVADFCTQARSGLERNTYTRNIEFIPSKEMPTRMAEQFYALLASFVALDKAENDLKPEHMRIPDYKGHLQERDKNIIIKIGLNSIPRKRRDALCALAQYEQGVTSAGLATYLHYETDIIKETLAELDALQLCHRRKFGNTYRFVIKEEWRDLILRIEHLNLRHEALESEEAEDTSEYNQAIDEAFDDGTMFELPSQGTL
jgi:hypothetical protein